MSDTKIAYIDQDSVERALVPTRLEDCLDIEVAAFENEVQAIRSLRKDPQIKIVLFNVPKERLNLNSLYQPLIKLNRNITFLYSVSNCMDFEEPQSLGRLEFCPLEKLSSDFLLKTLKRLGVQEKEISKSEFSKVPIVDLLKYNNVTCDLFVKLGTKKFVKIIKKNESFSTELLQKYKERKLKNLYIKTVDLSRYLEEMHQNIELLYEFNEVSEKLKVQAQLSSIEVIHKEMEALGLSDMALELSQKTMSSVISSIAESDTLWSIVKQRFSDVGYLAEHSIALAYISCAIAKNLHWGSSTTMEKLVMAAILHDIGIMDDNLSIVNSTQSHHFENLDSNQLKDVLEHPIRSVNLIKRLKELPPNVESIILEHHERPDGSGFPRKKRWTSLSPLSLVFIIAEDFYNKLTRFGKNRNGRVRALKELKVAYDDKKSEDIINALIKEISE